MGPQRSTAAGRLGPSLAGLAALLLLAHGCGDETDVTQILDARAPVVVRNVAAFPADQKIRITWSSNTEADLLGYNIYRSTSSDAGYQLIGSTGIQQAPFFQDEGDDVNGDLIPDGLVNQLRYFYKVTAFDREGREGQLSMASSVSAIPGVQPGTLQDLFVNRVRGFGGDEVAIVTWDLNRNPSVYGYFVYRQELGAPEGLLLAGMVPQGRNYWVDGALSHGSEFVYAVAPVTRELVQGRLTESRTLRIDPGDHTVPKPPGHDLVNGALTLQAVGSSGVTIRWGRPTENTDGSVLLAGGGSDDLVGGGFVVFRAEAPDGNYVPVGVIDQIGSEATFSFTDPEGTDRHFYTVRAFDRLGTISAESRRLSAGATVVPDVIRGIDAFASVSPGTINVSWDLEPTANAGYRLFRSLRRELGFEPIAGILPPTQNAFQDGIALLQTGETFFYQVAGLTRLTDGRLVEGSRSEVAPATPGPSANVFYLEAEDATITAATLGAFTAVVRQGFPEPFSGKGTLFVDPAPAAVPDGNITFLVLQWSIEIDASGPTGSPRVFDVLLRTIRNQNSGIFDVAVQHPFTGALVRRNGTDFFTDDFAFPPRVSTRFLGQIAVVDEDVVGGNPINETIQLTLGYQGFNPGVAAGNGELFLDGLVLVGR